MSYANMFGVSESKTLTAEKPLFNNPQVMSSIPDGINPPTDMTFSQIVNNTIAKSMSPQALVKVQKARSASSDVAISEFGTEAGKKVAALADTILQKTTTGKMGEFGDGITQILTLTSQVNVDDLNLDKKKGLVNSITGFFKKKRVEVLAHFDDTSKSIEKVAVDLATRQGAMKTDNQFLDKLYLQNMEEYHDLAYSIEAAEVIHQEMLAEYELKKVEAAASQDQFFIQSVNEFEQRVKRWEKQMDRLRRMQHVALLTAPEIRLIQSGNVAMVEKFDDLINTTIPAWKKQLSMTILALRQKENAELGKAMDDKTNQFFRKAAELNHSNAISVAQSSERSAVDIETLQFMQDKMIDSVKQVKAIQEAGRTERAAAAVKINELRDQMKTEMLSWK